MSGPPPGWVPVQLAAAGPALRVSWCALDWERALEPFFDQTVQRELLHPFNALFQAQTALTPLPDPVPPAGIILHSSRCGSSLLAGMLRQPPHRRVIAEPHTLTKLLRLTSHMPLDQRANLLRALVDGYSRVAAGQPQPQVFLKLDPSDTFALPLVRRAFPNTPWIFLSRDPLEILVSQIHEPCSVLHARHEVAHWIGLSAAEANALTLEEFTARLLGAGFQLVRDQLDTRCLLLDYAQLPDAAFTALPDHFGVSWTTAERARLRRSLQFHARRPSESFSADGAAKRRAASPAARTAAAAWAEAPYRRLRAAAEQGATND